jgi:myo-inositol-1(or 4)-monophosphatase
VEAQIRDEIAAAFPGDPVLGEESGRTGEAPGPIGIVDPIDGPANCACGGRHWCVSVALVEDGQALAGAVVAPALREVWLGRRGGGAWPNGRRVAAARTADPRHALVELGWSPRRPDAEWQTLAAAPMLAETLAAVSGIPLSLSQVLRLAGRGGAARAGGARSGRSDPCCLC